MKTLKLAFIATVLSATAGAALAAGEVPYAYNTASTIVRSSSGSCVRTGSWTEADGKKVVCPAEAVSESASVYFNFASTTMTPEGAANLKKLILSTKKLKVSAINIVGYTDRIGNDAPNNLQLSERRAAVIKQSLVNSGIKESLIKFKGLGPKDAAVSCDEEKRVDLIKCLAPNRRAEVTVVGTPR